MPKGGGKKKGPPYLDDPGCKYLVIIDPWGMASAKNRTKDDVDRLGSWVQFMLREQGDSTVSLEVVYMRGTQNEVILQLSENTNLGPLLGEHRWPEFLKSKPTNSSCTASYLLEYNYTVNGKPDNHNWADHYPESKPLWPAFKADITYPHAHYVNATRFGHLKSLVLPLPKERNRTPTPPPTDDLFSPYEPPAHHPSHSKLYPQVKAENVKAENANNDNTLSSSSTNQETKSDIVIKAEVEEEKPLGYIKKHDPYDEEESARLALRSDLPTETRTRTAVKKEEETDIPISVTDVGYEPPNALLESVALLEASRVKLRDQHEKAVKPDPDARENEYKPSSAWIETMQMYKQDQLNHDHRQENRSVKTEPLLDSITAPPRGLYHGRPPSESTSAPASVKQEPTHSADRVPIPAMSHATRDPRRRPVNNPPKRLKEEDEEGGINNVGFAKKMRV